METPKMTTLTQYRRRDFSCLSKLERREYGELVCAAIRKKQAAELRACLTPTPSAARYSIEKVLSALRNSRPHVPGHVATEQEYEAAMVARHGSLIAFQAAREGLTVEAVLARTMAMHRCEVAFYSALGRHPSSSIGEEKIAA